MGLTKFSIQIVWKPNRWSHYIEILHEQMVAYVLLDNINLDL